VRGCDEGDSELFSLPLGSSLPRKLGGLLVAGGILAGFGDGSMARTVGSWSLRGGSRGAPTAACGCDFTPPAGCRVWHQRLLH
jgi:hypothetical protein